MKDAVGSAEVRTALEGAEQVARDEGASEVSAEHLLVALARARPGHLGSIFDRYKVAAEDVQKLLPRREAGNGGAEAPTPPRGPLAPAPEIAAAVARAGRATSALGRDSFDATDLLLALLQDRASKTTDVLGKHFGLSSEKLVADLKALRGQDRAVAKAEGGPDGCAHHAGVPGAAEAAGVSAAPAGGVGLAAELRDLEARHRALCENFNAVRDRQLALVSVVRRLWLSTLLLVACLAALGYLVLTRR